MVCVAGLALLGCVRKAEDDGAYRVTVRLHGGALQHIDSATLLVIDPDYGQQRVLGGARVQDSTLAFAGHVAGAQLAYVDLSSDSLPYQFYFILEPTDITISIGPRHWQIAGGRGNRSYQQFLNRHDRLLSSRDSLWREYVRMGTDSTLTWDAERSSLRLDSLLQDSLQRIIVERINRGDLVSRLIKQRLLPTLTRESLQKIK